MTSVEDGEAEKARLMTRVACNACRSRKTACNGSRPTCEQCRRRGHNCVYDTRDRNETRLMALRRENESLRKENGSFRNVNESLRLENAALRHCLPYAENSPAAVALASQLPDRPLLATWYGISPATSSSNHGIDHAMDFEPDEDSKPVDGASTMSPSPPISHHLPLPDGETSREETSPPDLTSETEVAESELFSALTRTSIQQSTHILARIRLGDSWDDIRKDLNTQTVPRRASENRSLQIVTQQSGQVNQEASSDLNLSSPHMTASPAGFSLPSSDDPSPWIENLFDRNVWEKSTVSYETSAWYHEQARHRDSIALSKNYRNFGNLPFSYSIVANHYAPDIQRLQMNNFIVPRWAVKTIHISDGTYDPFHDMINRLERMIEQGMDPNAVSGPHVLLGALTDEACYRRASPLSQMVAAMVKSIKPSESKPSVTQYAMMWLYWNLIRWKLVQSPQTYADIPTVIRPTQSGIFAPHCMVYDFVVVPEMRDFVCQISDPNPRWLTEGCISLQITWDGAIDDALCTNPLTGELDLSPNCKNHAGNCENWSLGSAIEQYLPGVTSHVPLK